MQRKLISDAAAVALVRLFGIGLGFLVTVVIGRQLGAAGLGAYGYALMLLALCGVPVINGWAALVLRKATIAAKDGLWRDVKGLLQRGWQVSLLLSALFLMVGLLLVGVAGISPLKEGGAVAIALLAFVFLCDQVGALRLAVLRGLNHPVVGQLPEMVLRPALIIVCVLALPPLFTGSRAALLPFAALAIAALCSALAGVVVLWRRSRSTLAQALPAFSTREWGVASALLAGNSGLVLLNSYLDVLMLGAFSDLEQVGIYRVASQVALFSGFAYTSLNMLAAQQFTHRLASGDGVGLQSTATMMARLAFLGALPLPLVFWVAGDVLLVKLFGAEFLSALAPMFVLFLSQLLNAGMGMVSSLLIASGQERYLVRYAAAAVVLNVGASLILVPHFHALGAAAATALSVFAWNGLLWWHAARKSGIDTSVFGPAFARRAAD